MTVCLAYFDQKNNKCWIGSDSCASDSISHSVVNNHKCFNPVGRRDIVMACAGTFRLPNLLQYVPGIFPEESELPTEQIDIGYLVNEFTPVLSALTEDFDEDDAWELLIAVNKKIYRVQMDYSIVESADDADAIGMGGMVALGAFKVLNDIKPDMDVEDRIKYALDVACKSCQGCQPPFRIISSSKIELSEEQRKLAADNYKPKNGYKIIRHNDEDTKTSKKKKEKVKNKSKSCL